jgi:hypothetical protein
MPFDDGRTPAMREGDKAGRRAFDESLEGFRDAIEYVRGVGLELAGAKGFMQHIAESQTAQAEHAREYGATITAAIDLLLCIATGVDRHASWMAEQAYHIAYNQALDAEWSRDAGTDREAGR